MKEQPVLYLNKEDGNFYLYQDAAKQIGRDASVPYDFCKEEKDLIFKPSQEIIYTLYHYCNSNTLEKIIKSKSLWLTNCLLANDSKEMRWAINKLNDLIKYAKTDEVYPNVSNKEELISYINNLPERFKNDFLNNIKQNEDDIDKLFEKGNIIDSLRNNLMNIFNEILGELRKNISPTYISCFSTEKDSLGQWRGYANDGRGVAIGFNADILKGLENQNIYLNKVIYHENIQEWILFGAIHNFSFSNDKDNIKEWVYHILPTFKPLAFKEEKERRLIYVPKENTNLKINYYFKDDKLCQAYELPLENNYITEIILGPKCNIQPEELSAFFRIFSFDIKNEQIVKLGLSYR
jgi:hypothetical protein